MTTFVGTNFAKSTLAGPISNTATTANLAAGTGVLFPSPSPGQVFPITFISATNTNLREIAYVTGISGDTITSMLRGQEGTSALAWSTNDLAQNLFTAGWANNLLQGGNAQAQTFTYYPDSGTTNAIVITPSPNVTALTVGMKFAVGLANTNTSATVTLKVGPTAATQVYMPGGIVPGVGSLLANWIVEFTYTAFGNWEITSPVYNINQSYYGLTSFGSTTIDAGTNTIRIGNTMVGGTIANLTPANSIITLENHYGQAIAIENATSTVSTCGQARVENANVQFWAFYYQGTIVGTIGTNGSNCSFNNLSDYRSKNVQGLLTDGWDMIKAVPVHVFTRKIDKDQVPEAGFLAHEVEAGAPLLRAVTGEKDAEHDLGEIFYPKGTQPFPGGEVLTEDKIVAKNHPEPALEDMQPGTRWRMTHRECLMQQLDSTKLVPALWEFGREAAARIEVLEDIVAQQSEQIAQLIAAGVSTKSKTKTADATQSDGEA